MKRMYKFNCFYECFVFLKKILDKLKNECYDSHNLIKLSKSETKAFQPRG